MSFLDGIEAGQGGRLYRRLNDLCVFFCNRAPVRLLGLPGL